MAKRGEIEQLKKQTLTLCVGGENLLMNRFSSKAILQILQKQMGLASSGREKRQPQIDYVRSLYLMKGSFGFPARAFKAALVRGADISKIMKMTQAKMAFFVQGASTPSAMGTDLLVEVAGIPDFHAAMVRNDNGGTDVRFRGLFREWTVRLTIEYNAKAVTGEQIAQMALASGFGCGVGEDRPEKGGDFGKFSVVSEEDHKRNEKRFAADRKKWFPAHTEEIKIAAAEDIRLRDLLLSGEISTEELGGLLRPGKKNGTNGHRQASGLEELDA